MSKFDHLPKDLPSREIPFDIKVTGSTTGKEYQGSFVVKVPGVGDMSAIGVEVAKLGRGVRFEHLDFQTQTLNNAIGYLRATLIDGPAWFVDSDKANYGLNMMDVNVPIEIFNRAEDLVEEWRKSLRQQPKSDEAGK